MPSRRRTTVALLAALLGIAVPAHAAELDVDRTDDPTPQLTSGCTAAPDDCTLRLALSLADGDVAPDLVVLPAGVFARASPAQITVRQSVTIVGAGARRTIVEGNAPGAVLAFQVQTPNESAKAVGIRDLTITKGQLPYGATGGGIDVRGPWDLDLDRVEITGNTTRSSSIEWAVGAGIRYDAAGHTLRITDSTIAGNSSTGLSGKAKARGAGLYVAAGRAELTNTTVTGNIADGDGEAAEGGGIAVVAGASLLLDRVTLAANVARDTGANAAVGNLFAENGATVEARDSLIAAGDARAGGENCVAPVTTSDGGNAEDHDQCGFGAGDRRNVTPGLGPLADNGGPVDTMALLPGSGALDVRPGPCGGADVRGILRPQGPGCDAGAFELAVAPAGGGAAGPSGGGGATGPGAGAARSPASLRLLHGVAVKASTVRVGGRTRLLRLLVRGPVGARVRVACAGTGCPRAVVTGRIGRSHRLRVRALEGVLGAGATITVRVTKTGAVGRFIRLNIRHAGPPVRHAACLRTPSGGPTPCP